MQPARLCLWAFAVAMATTLAALVAVRAFAAPAALDCRNVALTTPVLGSTVSGAVEIRGRALIPEFQFYKVEYSPAGRDNWVLIGTDVVRQPVENGRLVIWRTTLVPDGVYRLRLHVVDPTGNFCESLLSSVRVDNAPPTATPTPEPTETLMLTVVPPQPTPTIAASVPVEFLPVPVTPGAQPPRTLPYTISLGDVVITGVSFLLGAFGMLAIALGIGVILFIRSLSRKS